MKKFSSQLTKTLTGFILLAVFSFSSCNDEDEKSDPTLVTVIVPADFIGLEGYSNAYVVASDKNGDVISFAELVEGGSVTLVSDTYKESTFTLSWVYASLGDGNDELTGESYYEVKRGGTLNLVNEDFGTLAQVSISNYGSNVSYYQLSTANSEVTNVIGNGFNNIVFNKESSKVFVSKNSIEFQPLTYNFSTTVFDSNASNSYDLSTVTTDYSSEIVNFSESIFNLRVKLYGFEGTGASKERFFVGSSTSANSSSLTVKYPGTAFSLYGSESQFISDDISYTAYNKNAKHDFAIPTYTISLETSGQALSYSTTGGGDWVEIDMDEVENVETNYDWNIYTPTGAEKSIKFVKLPTEVTSAFTDYSYENWQFDDSPVDIVDYADFSDISEYLTALNQPGYNYFDYNYKRVGLR
ncbi:MAG: hypothetical protein MUC38_09615 [Cyclobacteriaceae bacterium]|jgi:hypothetical protein|nr:hypothetical protein [Cyclobacteriaceae bacterium]